MRKFLFSLTMFLTIGFAGEFERANYFQGLCNEGDAKACFALGAMYHIGDDVGQSFKKAQQSYLRACELGSAEGCSHLAYMYESGHAGVNLPKAAEYYAKGCELGDAGGCASLGKLYENGSGVAEDMQKAVNFYDKACDGRDGKSCAHLGLLYENDGNDYDATIYYQKACDAGEADICSNLGIMYLNGKGVKVNEKKAYQLFQQACALGDESGCKNYEVLKNANWY